MELSSEQLSAAFLAAPAPMALVDAASGAILRANASFCGLTGIEEDQLRGRTLASLAAGQFVETALPGAGNLRIATPAEWEDSNHRLALAALGANDGIWDWDLVKGNLYRSRRYLEILGYSETGFPSETPAEALLHPEDRESILTAIRTHVEGHAPLDIECRVLSGSGDYRWIRCRGQAEWDEEGKPVRIAGSISDISDRKRLEEELARALQETSNALGTLIQAAPVAIVSLDAARHVITWNRAAEVLFGYRAAETIGRLCPWGRDDAGALSVELHARAMNGETILGRECTLMTSEGGRLEVSVSTAPLRIANGLVSGVILLAENITERKHLGRQLAASEEQYRLLFEANPNVMVVYDANTLAILAVNEAAVRHYGYSRGEFLAMSKLDLHPRGERERFQESGPGLNSGSDGFDFAGMWKHRRKDGSLIDVEVQRRRILFHGTPAVISLLRDVSARVRAEREIQLYREQLQALTGRLLTAHEQERRRIGSELHDDITQTLALLSIDAGKLASEISFSPVCEKIRELQQRIRRVSHDVRRLSHKLHPGVLEDLGLELALQAYCEELSAAEGIEIRYTSHGVPRNLRAETATALYRIAQEALHNVLKHARTQDASVTLEKSGDLLELRVEDHGVGFSPGEDRPRASLGLISMKERVRLLGGTISIVSNPGEGTVIHVSVPLAEAVDAAAETS
ncbi:MAG: PAS domain S-box protein [Bryobacteraceae bacterium]|nr:PAS domain S-box protein [Bryobacteraceae bacterium]